MKKIILQIDETEIESREQFFTFIDVILAHEFVKTYDAEKISNYLFDKFMKNKKDKEEKRIGYP